MLRHVGPFWAHVGPMLGLCWAHLGHMLGHVEPKFGKLDEFKPLKKKVEKHSTQDFRAKMLLPQAKG